MAVTLRCMHLGSHPLSCSMAVAMSYASPAQRHGGTPLEHTIRNVYTSRASRMLMIMLLCAV